VATNEPFSKGGFEISLDAIPVDTNNVSPDEGIGQLRKTIWLSYTTRQERRHLTLSCYLLCSWKYMKNFGAMTAKLQLTELTQPTRRLSLCSMPCGRTSPIPYFRNVGLQTSLPMVLHDLFGPPAIIYLNRHNKLSTV
jgi:hypothetical protein